LAKRGLQAGGRRFDPGPLHFPHPIQAYDAIVAAVDSVLAGFRSLACKLEAAEAEAMERGRAVDPEGGAAEVRDHLRAHRAERLRRFFDLLRDDNPPGNRQ
jgi:hypothetical protein